MKLTASKLRQNIYKILDEIIKSGRIVEIIRNGVILEISPKIHQIHKLSQLKKHKFSDEDSDNFVHLDWSSEWKGV